MRAASFLKAYNKSRIRQSMRIILIITVQRSRKSFYFSTFFYKLQFYYDTSTINQFTILIISKKSKHRKTILFIVFISNSRTYVSKVRIARTIRIDGCVFCKNPGLTGNVHFSGQTGNFLKKHIRLATGPLDRSISILRFLFTLYCT